MSTQPSIVRRILIFSFVSKALTFAVPLMGGLLVSLGGLEPLMASFALAGIYTCSGVVQPKIGQLMDRGYFRFALSAACLLVTLGLMGLMYRSDAIVFFLPCTLMLLLGLDVITTFLRRAMVGAVPAQDRGDTMLRWYVILNLGMCVAALVGFLFLETHRLLLFWADLLTTVGVGVFCFFLIPSVRPKKGGPKPDTVRKSLQKAFSRNSGIYLGQLLTWTLVFANFMVLPMLYRHAGLPPVKWLTVVLMVNTAMVVCASPFLNRISKRFSHRRIIGLGLMIFCLAEALIPFWLSPWGIVMTSLLAVTGEILLVRPIADLYYASFDDHEMGIASGFHSMLRSCGLVITPLVGAAVFGLFEHVRWGYALIFPSLGLASYVAYASKVKHPAKENAG